MHETVAILRQAVEDDDPAIASALKVIMPIDVAATLDAKAEYRRARCPRRKS